MYYIGGTSDFERDWASNKPGKMGFVNNSTGSKNFNYQDFNFWLDRPYLQSINNPLKGITRIENRPMRSVAELGRIFDPSWTHPAGRGDTNSPFNRGVLSPFRGGGTLAIGQRVKATISGTTAADHLDAKPWNLMDIFSIQGEGESTNDREFSDIEWRGRINLNVQKNFNLSSGTMSNHELAMTLPELNLGDQVRPMQFDFKAVAAELKKRVTKGGDRPDGSRITGWEEAMPIYSPGQLSELAAWNQETSFNPPESSSNNDLELLNRTNAAREEAMMRTANLVTTRSHCYRVLTAGEVLDPNGKILGRRVRENVIFFNCTWDENTGELVSVKPEILYVRSL
jgi:hypothetical protein